MTLILVLSQVETRHQSSVGGKCFALAHMERGATQSPDGIRVPETVCITAQAYRDYVATTGLRERIMLELGRKDFEDMRWEELWDASLRIRNLFLRTPCLTISPRCLPTLSKPVFAGRPWPFARRRRERIRIRSRSPGCTSRSSTCRGSIVS